MTDTFSLNFEKIVDVYYRGQETQNDNLGGDQALGSSGTLDDGGGYGMLIFDTTSSSPTASEERDDDLFMVNNDSAIDEGGSGSRDAYFVVNTGDTVTDGAPAASQTPTGGRHIFDTADPIKSDPIADLLSSEENVNETAHEIGHGISIRQVGGSEAEDSFDFTDLPDDQAAPVPPGEIIIMPDADCPLDDAPYDPIGDLLTRHENVSEADEGGQIGGGEIILVDIVGSSSCDIDLMLT